MPVTTESEPRQKRRSVLWLLPVGLLLALLAPVALAPVISLKTRVGSVDFAARIAAESNWPQGVSGPELPQPLHYPKGTIRKVYIRKFYILRVGDWHWEVWWFK